MIKTSENILRPCQCGCTTPIIEKSTYDPEQYRVMCPQCGNESEGYFMDSLMGVIKAWNEAKWKWDL